MKKLIYLIIIWSIVQLTKVLSNHFNSKILPKFLSYVRDKLVDTILDRYKTNYEDLKMGDTITKIIKAPFFFVAVGSQANVGGAASAPIVASAFSPSLAPVGVLMAVLGYAIGTYGAIICAMLMQACT